MVYWDSLRFSYRLFRSHPVAQQQMLRSMGRILAWQVRSRLFGGQHKIRWIENSWLVAERGMAGATGNLYFGLHEFADMAFLLHFLKPGDLFFDIGANIGSYSVLAGRLCGAQVCSFEPDPNTVAQLARNIAANDIGDTTDIRPYALGATQGEIGFTTGFGAMNRVTDDPTEIGQSVKVFRLDDILENQMPAMIKLDVEGHEDSVFAGAETVLSDSRLLAIEAETISAESDALIRANGFVRCYYDPFQRTLSAEPAAIAANNHLYLRDPKGAEARVKAARSFDIFGFAL